MNPSVPFDVLCAIMQQSQILDLLRWRDTAHALRRQANLILRTSMENLVDHYICDARYFLDVLGRHRAVVAGEVALCFFLDDPRVMTREMEVSIGEPHLHAFLDDLRNHYGPIGLFRMHHPSAHEEWSQSPRQR